MQLNNEETRNVEGAKPPFPPASNRKALLVWFTFFLALVLLITFNMQ